MHPISQRRRLEARSEAGRAYARMLVELPFCFACGRDETQRPEDWFAKWGLHRAHLMAGGSAMVRVLDRRAAGVLCFRCHKLHTTHGREIVRINGVEYPSLSNGNMLWLKRRVDPAHFDRAWLVSKWRNLPRLVKPVRWFTDQFCERRGYVLDETNFKIV